MNALEITMAELRRIVSNNPPKIPLHFGTLTFFYYNGLPFVSLEMKGFSVTFRTDAVLNVSRLTFSSNDIYKVIKAFKSRVEYKALIEFKITEPSEVKVTCEGLFVNIESKYKSRIIFPGEPEKILKFYENGVDIMGQMVGSRYVSEIWDKTPVRLRKFNNKVAAISSQYDAFYTVVSQDEKFNVRLKELEDITIPVGLLSVISNLTRRKTLKYKYDLAISNNVITLRAASGRGYFYVSHRLLEPLDNFPKMHQLENYMICRVYMSDFISAVMHSASASEKLSESYINIEVKDDTSVYISPCGSNNLEHVKRIKAKVKGFYPKEGIYFSRAFNQITNNLPKVIALNAKRFDEAALDITYMDLKFVQDYNYLMINVPGLPKAFKFLGFIPEYSRIS